jgi:putative flippase GtrA
MSANRWTFVDRVTASIKTVRTPVSVNKATSSSTAPVKVFDLDIVHELIGSVFLENRFQVVAASAVEFI